MKISRRNFLGRGAAGAAALGVGVPLLAACGSDSDDDAESSDTDSASDASSDTAAAEEAPTEEAASADFGTLSLQFSWLNSMSFGPEYQWDANGHALANGFSSTELIVGGPSVPVVPVLLSGQARFGRAEVDGLAAAIQEGAGVKVVAVGYQKSPYTVMSRTETALSAPGDLMGKKIAVDDNNVTLLTNLLVANGLAANDVEMIPANYDISLLSSDQVDGYLAYIPDEPISLQLEGLGITRLDVEDFGLPTVGGMYITTDELIANERDMVAAAIRTFLLGTQDFVSKKTEAIDLTVAAMGADAPGADYNDLSYDSYRELIVAGEAESLGLLNISTARQDEVMATLALSEVEMVPSEMFDLSILEEVLAEDPSLGEFTA
ncbi:MAG: ABC transporter substrate-binding protein [Actinomycetota bacterium]